MKLFNTRTHSLETFQPIKPNFVGVYSCGPTVYDHAHIGNLSTYIYADILRRTLQLNGYDVKHVMNFTDVDDKTIKAALEKYPDETPMLALNKLTEHYENIFKKDMTSIGNDTDQITFVKATDSIDIIQKLINILLEQGIAYETNDGVYFDINKYRANRTYGQLSDISFVDNGQACQRINNDEYSKDNPNDFALWKAAKPNEPSWEYILPSGHNLVGRPGWHIECSAMATNQLGQPFDIHTGGIDLIFPHHENEIAQSTAANQPELYANFFVHNEHLLVDNQKMSKSAHNFYTLPDIIEQGFTGYDFRMLVLQSRYDSPTNFSWTILKSAHNRWQNWLNIAETRHQINDIPNSSQIESTSKYIEKATGYLDNNLDTPNALAMIDQAFNLFTPTNTDLSALEKLLDFVERVLGLPILKLTPDITESEADLIEKRTNKRVAKDWDEADKIRDLLTKSGIYIKDGQPTLWTRYPKD